MIVGSGPSYESLKAKYTDAVFTGPLHGDELAGAYADSDVFVFPSKTDTFGLVLLEACAAGTPVAAFPVTGPKDVITDPAVGTLSEDLQAACLRSLELSSEAARTYAEGFVGCCDPDLPRRPRADLGDRQRRLRVSASSPA